MKEEHIRQFDKLTEEEQAKVLQELQSQTIEHETRLRLETDPAIQEYFQQFVHYSIPSFITTYAYFKAWWMKDGERLERASEYYDDKYRKKGWHALEMILKRKAMQQIAEWNAYQAEFPEIETSHDFALWDADILNVPYIPPIEREEVDIYLRYFNSLDEEDELEYISLPVSYLLQRRHAGEIDGTEDDFSSLYNTLKGAGTYLILPPHKTTIERKYEDLHRAHAMAEQQKEIEQGTKKPYVRDERPYISPFVYEHVFDFVKQFEDEAVMEKFRGISRWKETDMKDEDQLQDEEDLESQLIEMLRHNEPFPIEADEDFREALKKTFAVFEKQRTLEAIEAAYDEYLFRIENKMAFERDEKEIERKEEWIKQSKEYLIKARLLAGEPGDLNFY